MSVPIFLPGGGVAFVVIAVLDAPVLANGAGGTGFFFRFQAGKEDAGMALGRLVGVFLFVAQSRCTVMAERAPGSPAETGEMGWTAALRESMRP